MEKYCKLKVKVLVFYLTLYVVRSYGCIVSQTTASGRAAKSGPYCQGDIIFEDNFNRFDLSIWKHERTLSGGHDWQFQWYVNDRSNSFVRDGELHICPTLTSNVYGKQFVKNGSISIHGEQPMQSCTNPSNFGCEREGDSSTIINPVRSAKIRSYESFNFRYGKVEIRAKLPLGDWLWPYISLSPTYNTYGDFPTSGYITLLEARGNEELTRENVEIGVDEVTRSTYSRACLNCMPLYRAFTSHATSKLNFSNAFHLYTMEWSPSGIVFKLDDNEVGSIPPGRTFASMQNQADNPWEQGSDMAPFDQEFHFNIALAVGGTTFFSDDANTLYYRKPWENGSPHALEQFWSNKDDWLPSWKLHSKQPAAFVIDFIKVYAI